MRDERNIDPYKRAIKILWDLLEDAKDLGCTFIVCGMDEDVVSAIEDSTGMAYERD